MHRLARSASALAIAAAIGLGAHPAQASPEDVFGFGARSSALGGTAATDPGTYEAVYGNPALLSQARRIEITAGALGATFNLLAGKKISYEPLRGSMIGATLPIPFGGVLKDRIAIGLGFFTPFDLVVRGRILYPETPQFPIADRTQSVAVQAGIGVDLGHGLRIGGGFAALAALSGSVLVATDASGRIGTVVEDTLLASYGPIVGASFDFLDAFRVSLAFRGELVGRFNVVINVRDLGDIVVPPLNISGVAQYDPWQIALEVARTKGPWRAAIGAVYKHWSAFPGLAEQTVRCPVTDPVTGAPFIDPCNVVVPPKPGYHDTVTARAGVERVFDPARGVTLMARAGLFFEPSPAPQQTKESNVYDNARTAITLGYGVSLGPPFPRVDLDLFGQLHYLHARDHVKGKGVPDDNPGAPTVESSGVILAGGAAVGVKF